MYATVDHMVTRFGEVEMIRLSVADGPTPDAILPARIETALADASAQIDTYLRVRYPVPVAPVPAELVRAACILARFDLAMGGDREPSEQMRLARKEILSWLADIGAGRADLDGVTPTGVASSSGARVSDRPPAFFSNPNGGL
ncbi:DUF1320 domain-containing protein [Azorhizobium caulinodans]|uniref:gp436 family protein n=1 Tax=Azorhizobium caulinodans TaxID=7 RepID=UPI002FBF15A5